MPKTWTSHRRIFRELDLEEPPPSEWTNEEKVPSVGYSRKFKHEGYCDDGTYIDYRQVTSWFLTTVRQEDSSRLALPRTPNLTFSSSTVLYGILEPISGDDVCKPIKVVVQKLKRWLIDTSFSYRGIWILSSNFWYKLKAPDENSVVTRRGEFICQADVNLPMRAILGLVSNLSDMLGELKQVEKSNTKLVNYLELIHKHRTPEESHKLLNPFGEGNGPFDMELLRREARIVRVFLRDFDKYFTSSCAFIKGINQMHQEYLTAKKNNAPWITEKIDYLASASAAEERGRRTPWGDMLPGAEPFRPNSVLEQDAPLGIDESFNRAWLLGKANEVTKTRVASADNKRSSSCNKIQQTFPYYLPSSPSASEYSNDSDSSDNESLSLSCTSPSEDEDSQKTASILTKGRL